MGWATPMNGQRVSAPDADEALVRSFIAGDRWAFDRLYEKHNEYVYNIVARIVGRPEEARDVTQEVFLQVYRSLHGFRQNARFATWLYRIAVNRALDCARGSKRFRWLPLNEAAVMVADPADSPQTAAEKNALQDAAQQVLNRVPVQHRDVLVLKYFQDLSIEEIAEILGISETAAKVRLHRARKVFRDQYVKLFGEEMEDAL